MTTLAVHFTTPSILDLRLLTIFGVSIKPNTKSPIGYFGTGMKYAIAILLRHNNTIEIRTKNEIQGEILYTFSSKEETIRGEEIDVIYMTTSTIIDGVIHKLRATQLPFSLSLGRNWERWMAYRELETNTRDENGLTLLSTKEDIVSLIDNSTTDLTVISIYGQDFCNEVQKLHNEIFLDPALPILETLQNWTIHPGPSNYLYYRGIQVETLDTPSKFLWNYTGDIMVLTEDRTPKDFSTGIRILDDLLTAELSEDILYEILTASHDYFESSIYFPTWRTPKDQLLDCIGKYHTHKTMNRSAIEMWVAKTNKDTLYTPTNLTRLNKALLSHALQVLFTINVTINPTTIQPVEAIPGKRGVADLKTNKMYIPISTFDEGITILTGTLLEEYLHITEHLSDGSRGMQDWLINKLISLAGQLDLMNQQEEECERRQATITVETS